MTSERIVPLSEYHRLPQTAQTSDWYKRLLEVVCNNATLALFIMDEHQQCVYMNPAAETLTGYTLAETQGHPLHNVIHHTRPDGRPYPLCECPIDRAFPQNNQEQGEEVFVHKDGHFYPVAYTASPIREGERVTGTIIEVRDITQEKLAEQARQQATQREQILHRDAEIARQRVETVLSSISDGVFMLDRTWRYTYVNDRLCEMAGKSRDDMLGYNNWELFPEAVNTDVYVQFHRAMYEQVSLQFEYLHLPWNRWFEYRVYPSDQGITVFAAEISDRKQAEAALAVKSAELQHVTETVGIGLTRCSRDLRYLSANPAYAELVGMTVDEIVGRPIVEVMGETAFEVIRPYVEQVLQGDRVEYEAEFSLTKGEVCYLHVVYTPDEDSNGSVIGWIASIMDISDRKRNEAALRQSETILNAFIASSPVGMVFFDRDWRYIYANEALAAINGLPLEEHIGRTLRDVLPQWAPIVEPIFQQVIDTKTPLLNQEVVGATNPADLVRHCLINYFPVCLPDGDVIGLGVTDLDITERRQAEEALRQSEERLRVALQNAPITVFNQDQELRYTWLHNPVLYDPQEILGKCDRDFLQPEEADLLTTIKQRVLDTGVGVREDIKITRDGVNYYYDLTIEPLRDTNHKVIGITGAAINVSKTKQIEIDLRQSEERLRLAVEGAQMATWDVDLKTGKAIWSDLHFTMLGYEPTPTGEASEAMWDNRIHPDDAERIAQEWHQSRQQRRLYRAEYRIVRADNQQIAWLAAVGNFTYDQNGEPIRSIGVLFDITERKQAEEALRESEERFRVLADCAPPLIWLNGADGGCEFVNQAYLAFFGKTLEQVQGFGWQPDLHPDDLDQYVSAYLEAFRAQRPFYGQVRVMRADGQYRWLESYGLPRLSDSGETLGYVGTSFDITDRKHAEADLRQSEEQLRLATESANLGMWFWDVTSDQLVWTDQAKAMFGLPIDIEMSMQVFLNAVHPDDRPMIQGVVDDLQVEPIHTETEYRTLWADGTVRWILARGNSTYDANGTLVATRGVLMDITERKQAEAALRESIAVLNTVNQATPTLIYAKDRQGRLVMANPATIRLLGKPAEQLIGTTSENFLNLETAEQVNENDRHVIETGEISVFEEVVVLPEGTRTFLSTKSPHHDEQGNVIGLIGVSTDITERKQAELEREQLLIREQAAREEAQAANRIKDEFLAVLSHELRSPLNPILGWTKLMQTQTFTPEKTAQALATIERNAKLQAQLIEDLLDVSRILRGKMVLNVEPINLVTIIEAAIETVRLAAESKGITLRLVVSDGANQWERGNMNLWERGLNGASPPLPLPSSCPPVIEVWGDSARLQQIVWNLLTNAVKFTPYAGQVEVQLAPVGDGKWGVESGKWQMGAGEAHLHTDAMDRVSSGSPAFAQITVSDTGKGIDPNFLPHVFDYFRQEDGATTRKFGGLGLGLAIVRHLTEQHGGTIQADSPGEGQGATFTVRLPLLTRRRSEAIDEGQDPDSPMTSSQHPLAGLRILVVDDEADMRELMLTVLETYGAQVSIVQSAKEVLRLLQQTQPDLLISDIGMPDMDGYMLIQQVRKLPPDKGRYIPAIALTAYASEFDQQQALAAGFQQHIAKPVEPDVLVEAIATLLRL